MEFPVYKYCLKHEAKVYSEVPSNGDRQNAIDTILLGTSVKVEGESGEWFKTYAFRKSGWMRKEDLGDESSLKIFFLDVGQGDGALIEIENLKILIDAGAADNMYNYLTKYHFKSHYLDKGKQVHIDYLVVSHFDKDHFKGFTELINDRRFRFGTVVHPGILKFAKPENDTGDVDVTELGPKVKIGQKSYLTRIFDNLLGLGESVDFSPTIKLRFNQDCEPFIKALEAADSEQRRGSVIRLKAGSRMLEKKFNGISLKIDVLAPITEVFDGKEWFPFWTDGGKTVNGHSLVLKLTYGERTYLFGGDLNRRSQEYLMAKYGDENPFRVDVAKCCHHGSDDFSMAFLERIAALATVISSGDNEGHAHPRADAVGCAGKASRAKMPLVFSTELARSTNLQTNKIIFGMINSRCNGREVFFSQMKEAKHASDIWDSYQIPE